MAPYVPEEVNVFSVPHSRMKELVNSYFTLVSFLQLITNVTVTNERDEQQSINWRWYWTR